MALDIRKWTVEKYHRMAKDKLYSAAGIADYWGLDVKNRQLRVFRPSVNGYENEMLLGEDASISPLMFSCCNVAIASMSPPIF